MRVKFATVGKYTRATVAAACNMRRRKVVVVSVSFFAGFDFASILHADNFKVPCVRTGEREREKERLVVYIMRARVCNSYAALLLLMLVERERASG